MKFFSSLLTRKEFTIGGIRFEVSHSSGGDESFCVDLLSIPPLSAAVEVKANDLAQIPCKVYLRGAAGRQRVRNNLDFRLTQQPNRFQNAATFWHTVGMQATLGECFISTRSGELNILPTATTRRYVTVGGETRFATFYTPDELRAMGATNVAGPMVKDDYAWNEVLHLWTYQDEAGVPVPMRTRFRHTLGLAADVTKYTTNVFNRGGLAVGYLSTDQPTTLEKKTSVITAFKSLFKSARTGTGTDSLVAALDNGWRFNALNLSPQEMMLAEMKKDLRQECAQLAGVPLWKIGVLTDYKYATAEAAQREYLQSSLNPLLNQIESEVNCKLITDYEREFLYCEFDRDALISIDSEAMARIDDIGVKNGGISLDEWRERRNLPHTGQNIRQIPVNVTTADFLIASEALKLESLKADIALKLAQAQAAGAPTTAVNLTLPPSPPTSPTAPDPAPAPAEAVDFAASLSAIQARAAGMMATTDAWKDPAALTLMVSQVCGDVATLHGISGHLETFANKYTAAATKRLADADAVNAAHEVNRAVNAANHEALRLAHGVNVQVRWVGGANDGQVRNITEPWTGNLRHPPIADGECDCFLVIHKDS